uniref:Spermatid-associated protein n=1 Tax=Salvator merianae TaxID=96440 RepID=A0A8D0ATL9_SALMN
MDYIPATVKLSDDTFICLEGKWINESKIQAALSASAEAQQKHPSKKVHNDWTLWEENKALWEENKALRVENRALREENKALQSLRMENKGIQVIYDESLQQLLQQENKPLAALPIIGGLQDSMGKKALQVLREESKALQIFREKNLGLKVFPEEKKATPVIQKEKQSPQLIKEDSPAEESSKAVAQDSYNKPALDETVEAAQETPEENRILSIQERNKILSQLEENEALEAVQKLYQTVLFLLRENRALLEEKQNLHIIQENNKLLWEENNKLKFQQTAIQGFISKISLQIDLPKPYLLVIFPIYFYMCAHMHAPAF